MKEFKHTIKEVDNDVKPNVQVKGRQILYAPQPAITAPSGGATVDSQARTAINDIILKLQNLGLLE